MPKLSLLAALALLAATSPALAQTAGEVAERWGLLGLWKIDCSRGPTKEDPAFRYIVRGGKLFQDSDDGAEKQQNLVTFAAADAATRTLELTVIFPPGNPAHTVVLRREGGDRFSVRSNRVTGTNDYAIKDGKLPDGRPARAVLSQCSKYDSGR